MSSVSMIILCASALFVQAISGQVCGRRTYNTAPIAWAPGCGAAGYGNILASNVAVASGGGLGVTSFSPIAPNGISVLSKNDISGMIDAFGNLPVLAGVALEGLLPTSGLAGTIYSCGNGQVGMTSDSLAASGLSSAGYRTGYGSISAAVPSTITTANFAAAHAFGPDAYALDAYAAPVDFILSPCDCN